MAKHTFGGPWTHTKLVILGRYLKAYSTALKNQGLTLHYVDAFAGTGSYSPKPSTLGSSAEEDLFGINTSDVKGSARIALESRGFHHYHFNDLNHEHVRALQDLRQEYEDQSINISQMDANSFIQEMCGQLKPYDRCVMFIDPYATQLQWKTLETIASTGKVDVWLLFPFSALNRMLPKNLDRLPSNWEQRIDSLLGETGWRESFYRPPAPPVMDDLFGDPAPLSHERVDVDGLNRYLSERLNSIFPYCSEPKVLRGPTNSPLFYLYFAISNGREKALGLARRIVKAVLKPAE